MIGRPTLPFRLSRAGNNLAELSAFSGLFWRPDPSARTESSEFGQSRLLRLAGGHENAKQEGTECRGRSEA